MTWKHTIIATTVMVLTSVLVVYFSNPETVRAKRSFAAFPHEINRWQGVEDHFDPRVYQILGVDDSILANYTAPGEPWINLYVGYYQSQREGDLIHSPKNCMPGGGWKIIHASVIPLAMGAQQRSENKVIKLILQNGRQKQISLYWYQSRGRIISSEYMQKIFLVWDAITRNRTDGSFVRLIAPVVESEEKTLSSLKSFAKDLYPILQEFIPS